MKRFDGLIERPLSVITKNKTQPLYEFPKMPAFFGCVDTPYEEDIFAPMRWEIDQESGAVQLSHLIPLDILYAEQHLDGVGKVWENYYRAFADYIAEQKGLNVLEIGGGKGVLAHEVLTRDENISWTILEPNPIVAEHPRLTVINGFFDAEIKLKSDPTAVVMSQVFEHIYEPQEMASQLSKLLKINAKCIIAYPQLKKWLEKKYTNALNFEHTMLIDDFVPLIFQRAGFRLEDKTIYGDHSIFYTFVKESNPLSPEMPCFYDEYKSLFLDFVSYHEELVVSLNEKISAAEKPVYLFGAHIFSTFLFAFGLKDKIEGILDNGSLKKGRRFYGTNFIVSGPEILNGKGSVNVILKAGLYTEEIRQDILQNINDEVEFW